MPSWLANGTNTVCHYKGNSDPPKDYSQWGELIGALGLSFTVLLTPFTVLSLSFTAVLQAHIW